MNSNEYSDALLNSISTIVDGTLENAKFDKTVLATIVSCVDASIGKYKVKYQDGFWYAYSGSTSVKYTEGDTVYIQVPNGDMSKDKTILGTTEKLGIDYIDIIEEENAYSINGSNIVYLDSGTVLELCSYEPEEVVLYDAGASSSTTLDGVNVDTTAAAAYFTSSDYMVVTAIVKTNLDPEQRTAGNYGISFDVVFNDNATNDTVTRTLTFDVDSMEGNPYNYKNSTTLTKSFIIDGKNFDHIDKITIFVKDFPNEEEGHSSDIFFEALTVAGATGLTLTEREGVAISLIAPLGYIFNSNSIDEDLDESDVTRTAQALIRLNMKVVNNDTLNLPFYWFVENAKVTSSHPFYSKYGGLGWKCINEYNILKVDDNNEPTNIVFNTSSDTLTVSMADISAHEIKYKCAVVYKGTTFSKEFSFINQTKNEKVVIESTNGVEFNYDTGSTDLICSVYNNDEKLDVSNYKYVWSVTTKSGVFNLLLDTTDLNDTLNDTLDEYDALYAAVYEDYKKYSSEIYDIYYDTTLTVQELLDKLQKTINKYTYITRVASNEVRHININEIVGYNVYKCSVFTNDNSELLVGTAEIKITNLLSTKGLYELVINGGSQVFKYNEAGLSPVNDLNENPQSIPVLTFTLYDDKGNVVNTDNTAGLNATWTAPAANSMIVPIGEYQVDENYQYTGNSFAYSIADQYDAARTNNDIFLTINYNDLILTTVTHLTFTKEGDAGTNGTDYYIKVVPNTDSYIPWPMIIVPTTISKETDYTTNWGENTLRVEVWENGSKVAIASSNLLTLESYGGSGVTGSVFWTPAVGLGEVGAITVDNTGDGNIKLVKVNSVYNIDNIDNNSITSIIKARVKIGENTYYGTLPIVILRETVKNNNYALGLAYNKGFRNVVYKSDGTKPLYDNTTPFEITVSEKINNIWEDVSLFNNVEETELIEYEWDSLSDCLIDKEDTTLQKNLRYFIPVDKYNGSNLDTIIKSIVTVKKTNELNKEYIEYQGTMYIPIHMYLNRYENAALNGWDGNSIELGDGNGGKAILAPQIGAGSKGDDGTNAFTGIVMGEEDAGETENRIGLFGYNKGTQSIFLNARTGSATFGTPGKGQIIMDPNSGDNLDAILKSGYYPYADAKGETKGGMLINLSEPSMKFGTGNFAVDSSGYITAKGGGSIAGWEIDDYSLHKNNTGINSVNSANADGSKTIIVPLSSSEVNKAIAFYAGNTNFYVTHDGYLRANEATIGSGSNYIYIGKSTTDGNSSALFSKGKAAKNTSNKGFYLGVDGIGLGTTKTITLNNKSVTVSAFQVNNDGTLYAATGYIGSGNKYWTITSGSLTDGTPYTAIYNGPKGSYNEGNGSAYLGTDGIYLGDKFSVKSDGTLTASKGDIANWHIRQNALYTDGVGNLDGIPSMDNVSSMYIGSWGIKMGLVFSVNSAGYLTASSGTIGKWTIGANDITNGNITLDGTQHKIILGPTGGNLVTLDNSGDISTSTGNWSINANGSATFKKVTISDESKMDSGTISGSGVGVSGGSGGIDYGNMNGYVAAEAEIVAKKITSDYVYTNFLDSNTAKLTIYADDLHLADAIHFNAANVYTSNGLGATSSGYNAGGLNIYHGIVTNIPSELIAGKIGTSSSSYGPSDFVKKNELTKLVYYTGVTFTHGKEDSDGKVALSSITAKFDASTRTEVWVYKGEIE